MAAKHSSYSQSQFLLRRFYKYVRNFKKWCEKNEITYMSWEEACPNDICVLSFNEYEVGCTKANLVGDHECYFLTDEDYELFEESSYNTLD